MAIEKKSSGERSPWYDRSIIGILASGALLLLGQLIAPSLPILSGDAGDFYINVNPQPIDAELEPSENLPVNISELEHSSLTQYESQRSGERIPQAKVMVKDINSWFKNYDLPVYLRTNESYNKEHNLSVILNSSGKIPPFEETIYVHLTNPTESSENMQITIEGKGADGKIRNTIVPVKYKSSNDYFKDGIKLYNLGSYSDAIDYYNKAIERNSTNAILWKFLSAAYDKNRESGSTNALRSIAKSIEKKKNDPESWRIQSIILYREGRLNESLVSINQAIDLDKNSLGSLYAKAFVLKALGRNEDAKEVCEDLTEKIGLNSQFWNGIGWDSYLMGIDRRDEKFRFNESLLCSEEAIRIDSKNGAAWDTRGAALSELGRYDDAIYSLNISTKSDFYSSIRWLHRGDAYLGLKKYEDALVAFNESIRWENSYEAYLGKARALKGLGRSTEARDAYDEAEKLMRDDTSIYQYDRLDLNRETPFEYYRMPRSPQDLSESITMVRITSIDTIPNLDL